MQTNSTFFFIILCLLLIFSLLKPFLSKDKSAIWSPITMIALTLIYYVVKPSFGDLKQWGADELQYQWLFYACCVVFYLSILIGFYNTKSGIFKKWNTYFTASNAQKVALFLFVLAMICYVPFRGFRTTISADDSVILAERTGFVSYFIDLISLLVAASCLAFVGLKSVKGGIKKRIVVYIILYFTLVLFIVCGFRFRLVFLLLTLATAYHLYPLTRKINYRLFLPIAIMSYLLFAVMDSARTYGMGLDLEKVKDISLKDASKGANESETVCCFSIACIDAYKRSGDYIGLEPLYTALLMPIPRTFFPWKPKGDYLKDAEDKVGASGGAAFIVVTEAYIALGIFGVILYGFFMGWTCKKIWGNYKNSPNSIGAILLLSLFNGFCYVWISRGYMGAIFNQLIYFVFLPFWITSLLLKLKFVSRS